VIGDPYKGVSHSFSAANGGTQWWNPAAFAVPNGGPLCPNTATGFCGTLTRNRFYGPGYADVDLSVFKNIPITERLKIQLRAEMYNLTNRINLSQGSTAVGSTCGAANPKSPIVAQRTCTASSGFGLVNDTAGDFFGAPGIGPGEAFGMQLVGKIIF
jgi:TonB dependent receptor